MDWRPSGSEAKHRLADVAYPEEAITNILMNRAVVSIAGLAALYGALAWAFALPPFKPAPAFFENVAAEGQNFTCNAGAGPSLFIRFEEDGEVAVVRAGAHELRLPYQTSNLFDDVYQGGPWLLTLDPEANLTGPSGIRFRNCY